mgnify:CR=1 FL=1
MSSMWWQTSKKLKENKMKQLLIVLALVFAMPVFAGGEKKEVCEMVKDKKTNKEVKVCKQVKVHKKVEGEKVPTK